MLVIGWVPYQRSHAFDDVWTPLFDTALGIVIPFHIHVSVYCPLPESQIIWHRSHELFDAIPVFEASEIQTSLFLVQHFVKVRLHALLRVPTRNMIALFTHFKLIVVIVL
jgi:hypothetical protein